MKVRRLWRAPNEDKTSSAGTKKKVFICGIKKLRVGGGNIGEFFFSWQKISYIIIFMVIMCGPSEEMAKFSDFFFEHEKFLVFYT